MRRGAMVLLGAMALLVDGCGGRVVTVVPPARSEQAPATTPVPTIEAGMIRPPAVAGKFYPAQPAELAAMVDGFLAGHEPGKGRPIALVVPHAGYIYSGPVAGYAYAELRGQRYEAVILIGQNHYRSDFSGVAVYPGGAFETPLGLVPVHAVLAQALLQAAPALQSDPELQRLEHSLEVQLPFLQRVLPGTPIVPILIGQPTRENSRLLSDALATVLPGHDVLLIASSDLSHYPAYDDAVRSDQAILSAITTLDPAVFQRTVAQQMARGIPNLLTTCCGQEAIAVVMEAAVQMGANRAAVLRYANSGDVPEGRRDQVVGYGAVKFWKE